MSAARSAWWSPFDTSKHTSTASRGHLQSVSTASVALLAHQQRTPPNPRACASVGGAFQTRRHPSAGRARTAHASCAETRPRYTCRVCLGRRDVRSRAASQRDRVLVPRSYTRALDGAQRAVSYRRRRWRSSVGRSPQTSWRMLGFRHMTPNIRASKVSFSCSVNCRRCVNVIRPVPDTHRGTAKRFAAAAYHPASLQAPVRDPTTA